MPEERVLVFKCLYSAKPKLPPVQIKAKIPNKETNLALLASSSCHVFAKANKDRMRVKWSSLDKPGISEHKLIHSVGSSQFVEHNHCHFNGTSTEPKEFRADCSKGFDKQSFIGFSSSSELPLVFRMALCSLPRFDSPRNCRWGFAGSSLRWQSTAAAGSCCCWTKTQTAAAAGSQRSAGEKVSFSCSSGRLILGVNSLNGCYQSDNNLEMALPHRIVHSCMLVLGGMHFYQLCKELSSLLFNINYSNYCKDIKTCDERK